MIGISSCFYIKKQSVKGFTAFNGQKKRTPLPMSEDEFAEQLIKGGAIAVKMRCYCMGYIVVTGTLAHMRTVQKNL